MPEEKNSHDKKIDETMSELFTEKPSAPVAKREVTPHEPTPQDAGKSDAASPWLSKGSRPRQKPKAGRQ